MTTTGLQIEINDLPHELRQKVAAYVARLKKSLPKVEKPEPRQFGIAKGKIWMADDFDAPLDDFAEYM